MMKRVGQPLPLRRLLLCLMVGIGPLVSCEEPSSPRIPPEIYCLERADTTKWLNARFLLCPNPLTATVAGNVALWYSSAEVCAVYPCTTEVDVHAAFDGAGVVWSGAASDTSWTQALVNNTETFALIEFVPTQVGSTTVTFHFSRSDTTQYLTLTLTAFAVIQDLSPRFYK